MQIYYNNICDTPHAQYIKHIIQVTSIIGVGIQN